MNNIKKHISFILLICMVMTMVPAYSYADTVPAEETELEIAEAEKQIPEESDEPQETPNMPEESAAPDDAGNAAEENAVQSMSDGLEGEPEEAELTTSMATDNVAYIYRNNKYYYYNTLSAAVTGANGGETIVLIADVELSTRLSINKNIIITDDGQPHCIYACNTNSSSGSGRAIQVGNSKHLTVTGTESGGLTFIGHDKEHTNYNVSTILYAFTGELIINGNVEITECQITYGAGVICAGLVNDDYDSKATVKLNGCRIHDNTSTSSKGGTAVYVYPGSKLYLYDGTVIENNCSTSAVAGGVCNADGTAETHLLGNVIVQGNKKNCTKQENEGIANDGTASNIQISSPSSLSIDGDISGIIGIDYAGDSNGVFGKMTGDSFNGKSSLKEDSGNYSTVTYDDERNLYWHLKYSISNLEKTDVSKYSYKLGNASVNMTSTSDSVGVSITADCGSFTVPLIPDGSTFTGIRYDNSYTTEFSSSDIYRGISVFASFDAEGAENFIKSVVFTTPGENMSQTVTIGLYAGADSDYFGGSFYSYCGTEATYDWARIYTGNVGKFLAAASSAAENSYIVNRFDGADGWLGASLQSGMWCWTGDPRESMIIGGNASSSEGYNGAYANWAMDEPKGSNSCVFMDGDSGKWKTSDGTAYNGYYQETMDCCAAKTSNSISVSGGVTRLNAISPSFDGDIGMYYYFSFSDSLRTSQNAKVSVSVGGGTSTDYIVSDIIKGGVNEYGDYGIKVMLSAKQMNDTVRISIFDDSGKIIGSYGGEGKANYNLRYYARQVINLQSKGGSDKYNENFSYDIVRFVKAMLNYGAAAQIQFEYNTGNPANADYEDGIIEAPEEIDNPEDAVYKLADGGNTVFTGASLVADSSTILRIYLSSDYTAAVDGAETEVQSKSGNYYLDIPVNAKNLSHIYSIDANGKNLQINAYHVINALLDSNASDESKLTAYKLYLFGKAADSYYGVNVLSASAVEAVVNTAYAYLSKAQYIQYDQASIATTEKYNYAPNWRRQVRVYPENATGEVSNLHMDCSSFVWNVYCNAFGTENMESALGINEYDVNTQKMINVKDDTGTVVARYSIADNNPSKETVLSILQPGDIIVKRKSGHGHVAVWVGNGYIHCTGSSYSYDDAKDKIDNGGAIKYAPADTFSEAWWAGFETLLILRPFNVLDENNLSDYGIARSHLGGISVSKTAFVNDKELYDGLSVNPGDTVTYRITVSNPSSKGYTCAAKTIIIEDTDPGGVVHTFSATIVPNITKTFEYEYSVTGSAGKILSGGSGKLRPAEGQGKTGINDGRGVITFSTKSVAIENKVDSDTINKLLNADISKSRGYGIQYVNNLMSEVTEKEIALADSDSNLFTDIFKSGSPKTVISEMSVRQYLVSNFASGRAVANTTFNDENDDFSTCRRVRKIRTENLQVGDIVAVQSDSSCYYIYFGGQNMLKIIGKTASRISNADEILDGLLAKNSFAVLRVLGRN